MAWALASRGATVCVVEQEAQPGHHATGRSAALLNETVGHPVVGALARASRPFLASPPRGFVDHPLLSPRGLLWVGTSAGALDALGAEAPVGAASRIGPAATTALVPQLTEPWRAAGAVHEPDAQAVDVAALLQAYLRGLRALGGTLHTSSEALRLTQLPSGGAGSAGAEDRGPKARQGGWRVEAGGEVIECGVVVDAAGAWGDVVAERAGVRPLGLAPRRRTACIVPVPDGHDVGGWPLIMDVGGSFYAEPEPGGLLVSPGDETPAEPGDARPDELDVALALDRLREATTLPVRSVRRAWAGLRTFAPGRVPVAGFDPDVAGFYWLVGQGGAGIKTAPALAELAAADITGTPSATALPAEIVAALRPARTTSG